MSLEVRFISGGMSKAKHNSSSRVASRWTATKQLPTSSTAARIDVSEEFQLAPAPSDDLHDLHSLHSDSTYSTVHSSIRLPNGTNYYHVDAKSKRSWEE